MCTLQEQEFKSEQAEVVEKIQDQQEVYLDDVSRERFAQLLKKLQQLSKCVETTQSFQRFYNIIGLKRKTVIAGLKAIYQYFLLLGDELDKGLIRKYVGKRLIQGVHKYLQLQRFQQLDGKGKALYILQFQTKFSVCLQFFHTIKDQQSNIASQQPSKYQHIWQHIEFVSLGQQLQIQKKYNSVKKMLTLTTTAIITEEEVEWSITKKIIFGLSYPRSLIDFNTARLKSFIFYKYPTIKLAKNIWNIPELGASKQLIKIVFENIVVNKKIYIPMECGQDEYPDIWTEGKGRVQERVLNHEQLEFKTRALRKSKSRMLFCCNQQIDVNHFKQVNTIMIHMHGGGFIALSSRMMQTMTRRWANKLKIPIFSIDYRKPPNDPFPAAPNDCLAVYKFIIQKIKHYMNINPVNVYLAGDSAGGNLACSLMGNILKEKLAIPKGIYLAYPALDLRTKFSPSKIHAVTDPLLWPSMLMLCLNEYLAGKAQQASNPLASPILLTQQFVNNIPGDHRFPLQWPKTLISVGQLDPLYDDSIILMQKLRQSNIQCKCRVYKQLSHGFLSTNLMISECELTLRDSIEDLKRLIGFVERKQGKRPIKTTTTSSTSTNKMENEVMISPQVRGRQTQQQPAKTIQIKQKKVKLSKKLQPKLILEQENSAKDTLNDNQNI